MSDAGLKTSSDLKSAVRETLVVALNHAIADSFALYLKTKNFHWHVTGPHFRDYHLLFDEQASQLFAMIDVLAERVRKLGGITLRSVGEVANLQRIKDDNKTTATHEMLWHLLEDNKAFVIALKKTHEIAAESGDCATTSLLENYIDEGEQRVWFLSANLTN